MKEKNGQMGWSGDSSTVSLRYHPRKSLFSSIGLIVMIILLLTVFLTSTVYAASEDLFTPVGYAWGESTQSSVDGIVTDDNSGEVDICLDGDIGIGMFGYAWGE